MVTIPQPSWLSSLNTITTLSSPKPTLFTSTTPKTSQFKNFKLSSSLDSSSAEPSIPNSSNSTETPSEAEPGGADPVKLAFARAKAYKKSIEPNPTVSIGEKNPVQESPGQEIGNGSGGSGSGGVGEGAKELPVSVKMAMEKAKEYKKSKGIVGGSSSEETPSGLRGGSVGNSGSGYAERSVSKKEPTISSINFVGLNFADKKEGRGLPAGLIPIADPFPQGDLPEVELIIGDASNFVDATTSEPKLTEEENSDLYKPKVSTWGVFPRPGNISKTFGGGRVIRPGELIETAEDKAAKEARTRQLLAAYKNKIGLNIDAKLKSECEKALKDGDSLMDLGKLKEALPYYEKVMNKLVFQSELHGLAALQWSICQDSLSRANEARIMYEKLQTHPNVRVSKKARQFIFAFQAMEMLKVTSSPLSPKNTGFQNFFEAFIEDKTNYSLKEPEVEEGALSQALPYIIFLVSPIFILILFVIQKGI
ncbi:hypothetical protein L1049_010835 [Liquidambar formosana]|uniref:Uncharacterized protein n=1 Tax=Liquidambar formosana TaxID=63359 RepID=A0AAP0RUG0_LIQFO